MRQLALYLLFASFPVVCWHEGGHLVMAKFFDAIVSDYVLAFGPKVELFQIGETKVSVGCIPLGGYVRIVFPEEMNQKEKEEFLKGRPDLATAFRERTARVTPTQKFWIAMAGPMSNVLLFILIPIVAVYFCGIPVRKSHLRVLSVEPGSAADLAGIKQGDEIWAVRGQEADSILMVLDELRELPASAVRLRRRYAFIDVSVTRTNSQMKVKELGANCVDAQVYFKKADLKSAVSFGLMLPWKVLKMMPRHIRECIAGDITPDLPFPFTLLGSQSANTKWMERAVATAGISLNLAIFNMLPLGFLDGGRIFLHSIRIAGYEPTEEFSALFFVFGSILAFFILPMTARWWRRRSKAEQQTV